MKHKTQKLYLMILTVMALMLIVACAPNVVCNKPYIQFEQNCCLDENRDSICDSNQAPLITNESGNESGVDVIIPIDKNPTDKVNTESEITATISNSSMKGIVDSSKSELDPELDYNLINALQKLINRLNYNEASWTQLTKGSPFFDLGNQKLASIETLQDPIVNGESFINRFAGANWKSIIHYHNSTAYDQLFKPMVESEFDSSSLYKKYKQDSVFIEKSIDEQAIETPNGIVLEYQETNWRYDEYGFFKGEYQNNLLVYKIFCSPSLVVYLSPSKDDLDLNLLTATLDNTRDVWNQNVVRLRPGMLQKAQKVMEECPTPRGGTNNLKGFEYQLSQTYVDHYPTYLYYHWDISTKINPDISRSVEHSDLNAINKIEVTLENKEKYDLGGPILIDIRVKPDSEPQEYLIRDKRVTGKFQAGETINRVFIPFEPIEFDSKLDIEVRLYTEAEGYYIRPQNFVLNY